jgi:aspartate beta-hydroxylase
MMDYHIYKDMINRYLHRYAGDDRPVFFDISQTIPEFNTITNHFSEIQKEYQSLIHHKSTLPRYHDIDPGEAEISDRTAHNWNVYMLYLLGYQLEEAQQLCPKTCELIKTIPGLTQAFFSILDPKKSIPLHEGPYRGYLRYHLGIDIPKENKPKIIVNNQAHCWQEGEAVLFDDSWPHEVINESDEPRAVLIIDVLRPLPLIPNLVNRFITNVIGKQFYGKKVIKRFKNYGETIKPIAQ